MLDTTKRNPPEVTNLQPSARGRRNGPPAAQALARLKGAKKKRKKTGAKKKRARLVGAARAGSVAASQPKKRKP